MSVQNVNLPLGLGQLYAKHANEIDSKYRLIGELKGDVAFTYTKEEAEQKPGTVKGATKRVIVEEKAALKATICDFKMAGLIDLLGLSISSTGLTQTESRRLREFLAMGSTTATKTLSGTPLSITSVAVNSLDRGTDFVLGVDYTQPAASTFAPLLEGFANRSVEVHYNKSGSVETLRVGDRRLLQELSIQFVHRLSSGKHIIVKMPKSTCMGEIAFPWNEKEYTVFDVTFGALMDVTLPEGERLFRIIREQ